MLQESTTSFTASCLVHDEKHVTLYEALTHLIVGLYPLDTPRAIVCEDLSPGFQSMANNDSCVKNKNRNTVAEKAVHELEKELIQQEPGGRPVSAINSLCPLPILTSVSTFLVFHLTSCRLNAISSPANSCCCLITTSYPHLVNMSIVPLTMPSVRSPTTLQSCSKHAFTTHQ